MKISINSKEYELPRSMTIAEVIEHTGLPHQGIAVALNGKVVTTATHATTKVADGDALTVIKAFYGG